MTQEEKQLLLIDLFTRLPYGVKTSNGNRTLELSPRSDIIPIIDNGHIPYLRPMSSMTDEERKVYKSFIFTQHHEWDGHGKSTDYVETDDVERYVTWLNRKMFDHRGLIPMGLALEAPADMYI